MLGMPQFAEIYCEEHTGTLWQGFSDNFQYNPEFMHCTIKNFKLSYPTLCAYPVIYFLKPVEKAVFTQLNLFVTSLLHYVIN